MRQEPWPFSLFWRSLFFLANWLAKVLPPWGPEYGELAGLQSGTGSTGMPEGAVTTPFPAGAPLSLSGD